MGGIVDKILMSHAKSDKKFFEFEEKECVWRNERERENEKGREFQLRMMSMIMQAPAPSSYPPQYMQALSVHPPVDYSTNTHIEEF